jgi:predicted DNA binding protein
MIQECLCEKTDLEEFVDSEGGIIGGDRNVTSNSEIETGPVQKPANDDSDYEKGISTTTDRASRYKQSIPWFATYSSRGSGSRGQVVREVLTKKQVEEKINDLVKKNKYDNEIADKNFNSKVSKVVDIIVDTDLTEEQMEEIAKALEAKKANPSKTKNL